MKAKEAKKAGYTHHAKMYGVSGFAALDGEGIKFAATTYLGDIFVEILIGIEVFFAYINMPINEEGFPVLFGEKL